jgi:hypothetical protein
MLVGAPTLTRAGLMVERSGSLAPTKTVQAGASSGPLQSQGLLGSPIGRIQIDKFDTLGGTRELTGVSVTVHGQILNDGYYNFIAPNTTIGVNVRASDIQVRLLPGGPVFDVPLAFEHSTSESTGPTDPVRPNNPRRVDLQPTDRQGFAANASDTNPFLFSDPNDLSAFIGPGALEIPVFASALTTFSSSTGNGKAVINTYAGADVTVRYRFRDNPPPPPVVPEPSSLLAAIVGAATCAAALRRKRRTR